LKEEPRAARPPVSKAIASKEKTGQLPSRLAAPPSKAGRLVGVTSARHGAGPALREIEASGNDRASTGRKAARSRVPDTDATVSQEMATSVDSTSLRDESASLVIELVAQAESASAGDLDRAALGVDASEISRIPDPEEDGLMDDALARSNSDVERVRQGATPEHTYNYLRIEPEDGGGGQVCVAAEGGEPEETKESSRNEGKEGEKTRGGQPAERKKGTGARGKVAQGGIWVSFSEGGASSLHAGHEKRDSQRGAAREGGGGEGGGGGEVLYQRSEEVSQLAVKRGARPQSAKWRHREHKQIAEGLLAAGGRADGGREGAGSVARGVWGGNDGADARASVATASIGGSRVDYISLIGIRAYCLNALLPSLLLLLLLLQHHHHNYHHRHHTIITTTITTSPPSPPPSPFDSPPPSSPPLSPPPSASTSPPPSPSPFAFPSPPPPPPPPLSLATVRC